MLENDVSLQVCIGVFTSDSFFYHGALSRLDVRVLLLFLFDRNGFHSLRLDSLLQISLDALLRCHMLLFYSRRHLAQLTWTRCLFIHVGGALFFFLLLIQT